MGVYMNSFHDSENWSNRQMIHGRQNCDKDLPFSQDTKPLNHVSCNVSYGNEDHLGYGSVWGLWRKFSKLVFSF